VTQPATVTVPESMRTDFSGSLLGPDDPRFEAARRVHNGLIDKRPALIAQCHTTADVRDAVELGRQYDLELSVRGGGHNVAGNAVTDGGLMIDLAPMRGVHVDVATRRVWAQGGATWRDYNRATGLHGLATTGGVVSTTGIGGLTLGGGEGWLMGRHAMVIDNLLGVEIVTADLDVLSVNADQHPDLFWAVRGGGGNFGVVTRFSFRLHQVGPMITGGLIVWSAERAAEVLAAYRELTESAPRELTAATIVRLAPPAPFLPQAWHGKPIVGIQVCHSGANPDADLAAVRALGNPIVDLVTPKPYAAVQSMLNAMEPKWLHRYWKAEFLPGLSSEFLDAFRSSALRVTSPLSQSIIFHVAGALNDHEDDDGAVGNRDAHYIGGFAATWPPGAPADPHVAWVRESWERIRPFSTGGNYVNFQLADDDDARTAAAYGANYQRLQRVKADYDPGNLFRVNRNIPPAP
jgi:FAD/FMN-containing dehydrogenase